MWLSFGILAVIFAILNLVFAFKGKEAKYFRFMSMALTILTVWKVYDDDITRFFMKDFATIEDISGTMTKALFVCSAASIAINGITLFKEKR